MLLSQTRLGKGDRNLGFSPNLICVVVKDILVYFATRRVLASGASSHCYRRERSDSKVDSDPRESNPRRKLAACQLTTSAQTIRPKDPAAIGCYIMMFPSSAALPFYCGLTVLLVCMMPWSAAGQTTENGLWDTKGTEFVLSFIQNLQRDGHRPRLHVTGSSPALASVVVDVPLVGFTEKLNVRFGEVATVELPRDGVEMLGSRKGRHAVHIQADNDIMVYGVFTERDSSDAYLGLPTDALGTEYLVPCNTITRNRPEEGFVHIPSEFGVVGVYDNTTVTIVPKQRVLFEDRTYFATETITTTLDRFETLQIQSSDDLTGSRIVSNKPVAVLSGNLFASVGHQESVRGSGTHIVEMIPPVHGWGREFALVALKGREQGDVFRVLAARDGTQVFTFSLILFKFCFHSFDYSKSKTVDQARADPFMMLVPAVSQFAANYSFLTVDFADLHMYGTYHLNIVVKTSEKEGLRLDDNPLDPDTQWFLIPDTQMSAARVDVRCGSHTLVHQSPTVTFGVSVYGYTDYDGYGYPGGLLLPAHATWRSSDELQGVGGTGQSEDVPDNPQHRENRGGNGKAASTNIPSKTVKWKDYAESKVLIVLFCCLLLGSIIAGVLYIKNQRKDDFPSTSMEGLELADSA
ncbi:PREDICTED: IgGFc-binding protein-like [Branchiostoma belcheri]|uniref:IgGFc-binding protein-like n=1 Tax=Branchiostoma belcheri TaxID=7741 RepID=A0A6P4XSL8_BRABE|nr:PREDICTED: IgGFc-binding protein-like [Branchiostoma belcheri]